MILFYSVLAVLLVALFLSFRELSVLKKFWKKASSDNLKLRTELSKKDKEILSYIDKIEFLKKYSDGLEQEKEEKILTISSMNEKEKTSLSFFKNEIQKESLKNINLKKQVDFLSDRLEKLENIKSNLEATVQNYNESKSQELISLKTMVEELNRKNQDLEQNISKVQNEEVLEYKKQVDTLNNEVLDLKKKILKYSFLYKGMKGLKEMMEERNSNLEVAVKSLSVWVLKKKRKDFILKNYTDESFGSIVGEALESIGESLIKEDDSNGSSVDNGSETILDTQISSDMNL